MSKLKLALSLSILILIGAGCPRIGEKPSLPAPSTPSDTQGATSEAVQKEVTVEITADGFSPAQVTVLAGTAVKFVNIDSTEHWPASGVHPTHQICQGFDALGPLAPGESYSFTFTAPKVCPMHDHLNPATRGAITVKE